MKIDKKKTYTEGPYSFVNFLNLDENAIEQIRLWRNHPDIRKRMYNREEISYDQHHRFIKSLFSTETKYYWLVFKEGNPVGVVNIVDVDANTYSAQFGYYLLPDFLSNGMGLEFISKTIYFIFSDLGLTTLFGRTEVENKNALGLNYHLGFKMRPDIVEIDGIKYVEQDCCSEDFLSRYASLTIHKELLKSLKEFNQIYKTQILI